MPLDSNIRLSAIDKFIVKLDRAVRTLSAGSATASRPSPAKDIGDNNDAFCADAALKEHVGGLIRVNHTGEVCAQALYQGQALTARNASTRHSMQESADEEEDHLAWCEARLNQLGEKTSLLNPAFYILSFGIGSLAGLAGDKWSLGFIAATEDQVCAHLRNHIAQIPDSDQQSLAILEQMLADEERHGNKALVAGGIVFSDTQKKLMTLFSKFMTHTAYKF